MKQLITLTTWILIAAAWPTVTLSQSAPAPKMGRRPAFWVTTTAWPDGGEIPLTYASARGGENKSPAFEFHWNLGTAPTSPPDTLQSYAVIFHDMENSANRTTGDTVHWTAYNIPGTAKGLPEGLAAGNLEDGTRNGPSHPALAGKTPAYFGPGAPAGPIHHYVFEFYALDTKLDLPADATRDDLRKALDGHIIGKAVWFGRFHVQGS